MKIFKSLSFVLIMVAMVLVVSHEVQARGCSVGAEGEGNIVVDSKASGTKYPGMLTIYYMESGSGDSNMHLFLRLQDKKEFFLFSGVVVGVDYLDIEGQQTAIQAFIEDIVLPGLYCVTPIDGELTCPWPAGLPYTIALKAVDLVKDSDPFIYPNCLDQGGDYMYFTMMDIAIAVQDK